MVRRKCNAILRWTCSFRPVSNCSPKRRASLREEDAVVVQNSLLSGRTGKLISYLTLASRSRRKINCAYDTRRMLPPGMEITGVRGLG